MASDSYLQLVEDIRTETEKLIETDSERLHLLLNFEDRRKLISDFIKRMRRMIHSWKKDLEKGKVGKAKEESTRDINQFAEKEVQKHLTKIHELYGKIHDSYTLPTSSKTEEKIQKFLELTSHIDKVDAKTRERLKEESRIFREELDIIHSSENANQLFYEMFGTNQKEKSQQEGLIIQWTRLEYQILEYIHNQLVKARQSLRLNKKFSTTELTTFIENVEESLEKLEHTIIIEDHKLRPLRSFLLQQGKTLRSLEERLGKRTGWFAWILSGGKRKELTWQDVKTDVLTMGYTDPGDFSEYLTALKDQLPHYKIPKEDRHKIELYLRIGQTFARKARKKRTSDFLAQEQELLKYIEERKIDLLTGLQDFRSYNEHLIRHIVQTEMGQEDDFCYVFFDIDRFKWFNDAYSHQIGDDVLRIVATLLLTDTRSHYKLEEKREPDVAFRIGGEEIVLLLPNTPLKDGAKVADRNREGIEQDSIEPLREINQKYLSTPEWYDKILRLVRNNSKHEEHVKLISEYLDKVRLESNVDKKLAMIQENPFTTVDGVEYTLEMYLKTILHEANVEEDIKKFIWGLRKNITISGGVISYQVARDALGSLLPSNHFTADDLRKKAPEIGKKLKDIADRGLYKSKESGRNKITAVYRPRDFVEEEEIVQN